MLTELSGTSGHTFSNHRHLTCLWMATCWVSPVTSDILRDVYKYLHHSVLPIAVRWHGNDLLLHGKVVLKAAVSMKMRYFTHLLVFYTLQIM